MSGNVDDQGERAFSPGEYQREEGTQSITERTALIGASALLWTGEGQAIWHRCRQVCGVGSRSPREF